MQVVRLALRATCGIHTQGVTRGMVRPFFLSPSPAPALPHCLLVKEKTGGCGLRIARIRPLLPPLQTTKSSPYHGFNLLEIYPWQPALEKSGVMQKQGSSFPSKKLKKGQAPALLKPSKSMRPHHQSPRKNNHSLSRL
jgi:hypothetical protein